jgi:hypothetical protein
VLLPFMWHVDCACFNGLWGRGGFPLTGRQRRARAFTRHPAADWRALYAPHIGEGARWQGGEAPLGGAQIKACQFVMHGMSAFRSVHLYVTRCAR